MSKKPTQKKEPTFFSIPVYIFVKEDLSKILKEFSVADKKRIQAWMKQMTFEEKIPPQILLVPDASMDVMCALFLVKDKTSFWDLATLNVLLPLDKKFIIKGLPSFLDPILVDLAFRLNQYAYTVYKSKGASKKNVQIEIEKLSLKDKKNNEQMAKAIFWVRDLINAPASHLGPKELGDEAQSLSKTYKDVQVNRVQGKDLIKKNYPCVYTVGQASAREPEVIDIRWGNPKHPKVTLVGKGVCFDSGGLDIKTASGMQLMKKDMGGAAYVLGLASLIMEQNLPISLRVLIGAAENSISGNAMRPLDVIKSRKGTTIEIGNTDAEGRLVLADLLYEASTENPDLIIDCATLTGAARVALGPDVPVVFSNKEDVVQKLLQISSQVEDPLWPLPLWSGYRGTLESKIADISSTGSLPYAGAITAALFLQEFVSPNISWMHIDMMAWNLSSRPGRPEGGEAMALRALFAFLKERYAYEK